MTLLDDFLEDNIDLYEGCPAESWTLLIVLLFAVRSSFNSTNTCIYSMSVNRCINGFIKYNLQIVSDRLCQGMHTRRSQNKHTEIMICVLNKTLFFQPG